MSNLFTNNYPISASVFPTMLDHVDAIKNIYFYGLHTEILNIENIIGGVVHGDYPSLRERLDNIVLSTAKGPAIIIPPEFIVFPDTVYASLVKENSGDSAYNVIRFTDGAEQGCNFNTPIPYRTGSGHLKVTTYCKTSAVTGQAWVQLIIFNCSDNGAWPHDLTNWLSTKTWVVANAVAQKLIVTETEITLDSYIEGRNLFFQAYREGQDGTDTLNADLDLIAVKIEEL